MGEIYPCCLTIAGSDSGGNAGVQADLRTFHAFKIHGCTAFAALTAQNPFGVRAVLPVPREFLLEQLDAIFASYQVAALKTGMLGDVEAIETVAEKISMRKNVAKVVDPVMVATSGFKLIKDEAIISLKRNLFPMAAVITPNIPEAEILSGIKLETLSDVKDAAKRLYDEFGCAVLVKGGHRLSLNNDAQDTLFDGKEFSFFSMPWIENPISTHGTGCTLSAAIAASLALGNSLREAVKKAKEYVYQAIAKSYLVGEDCGVLY
jgi:hydroxymethylpyrimidine kinase/phosphomethylpyrimidine kinase